jgi:hypothetical protein
MHSGVLRVARGGSGAKAPPLAARPGSPEAPVPTALSQWTFDMQDPMMCDVLYVSVVDTHSFLKYYFLSFLSFFPLGFEYLT